MHRVLMLHAGALGDCVLALHLAAAVRRCFEGVKIDLVARSEAGALAASWGLIDRFNWPEQFGLHSLFGDGQLPQSILDRLTEYDGVINLLGGPEVAISKRLRSACPGAVFCVDPAPDAARVDRHIVEQWMARVSAQGLVLELDGDALHRPNSAERAAGRVLLEALAGPVSDRVVICHPGSGGRAKCCPLEILEQLMGRLGGLGITGLWMVGPTESDWLGPDFQTRLAQTAPVLRDLTVTEAANLMAGADLFVGNDAGMTHLAAALGLATVALFGPTDPVVWKPLGSRVRTMDFLDTPAAELIEALTRAAVGG